jgi:hypothetical protein
VTITGTDREIESTVRLILAADAMRESCRAMLAAVDGTEPPFLGKAVDLARAALDLCDPAPPTEARPAAGPAGADEADDVF